MWSQKGEWSGNHLDPPGALFHSSAQSSILDALCISQFCYIWQPSCPFPGFCVAISLLRPDATPEVLIQGLQYPISSIQQSEWRNMVTNVANILEALLDRFLLAILTVFSIGKASSRQALLFPGSAPASILYNTSTIFVKILLIHLECYGEHQYY
jgi:hypothetical protein